MRLRTLPLSLAGVILGSQLAKNYLVIYDRVQYLKILCWLFLTTICLQILSNLSNELGDYLAGTDNEKREGPMYSLADGQLTVKNFRILIGIMIFCCILFGTLLVWTSFGTLLSATSLLMLILGASAIWAAMHYTLGEKPYGYRGWGDLFVFIFFGLVSVLGAYFVIAHTLSWQILLPAATIGCFSVGVLNVNNIRDMKSDAENRMTIPLRIGERKAKIYQTALIAGGWSLMIIYVILNSISLAQLGFTQSFPQSFLHWTFLLTLPLYIIHLRGVWTREGKDLDSMLPLLVIATFFFSLLAGNGLMISPY